MKPMKEQRAVIVVPKNAQMPLSEWLLQNFRPKRKRFTRRWLTLFIIVRKLEQVSDFEFEPGATYWIDFTGTHNFKVRKPS